MNVNIDAWKDMWTVNKDKYWLIYKKGENQFTIFDLEVNGFLTIENDIEYGAVIEKMIISGVKKVEHNDYQVYLYSLISPSNTD